jgi:hypothetical protein
MVSIFRVSNSDFYRLESKVTVTVSIVYVSRVARRTLSLQSQI